VAWNNLSEKEAWKPEQQTGCFHAIFMPNLKINLKFKTFRKRAEVKQKRL